jgi:hypothetical protein
MENPVVLPDGWSYDASYIDGYLSNPDPQDMERWDLLDGSQNAYRQGDAARKDRSSPHDTTIRMHNKQIPNWLLKQIIDEWNTKKAIDTEWLVGDGQ